MKDKILNIMMSMVGCLAMFSAVFIANTVCPFFSYQDKEPESVRKLRKF